MKRNWKPVCITAAGILLMLYPFISNWVYNRAVQSEASVYEVTSDDISEERIAAMFTAARIYNEQVTDLKVTITDPFLESDEEDVADNYYDIFNPDGTGIMCFVEIPRIHVCLPVYHGTDAGILEKGAGHIQGTAFPTGDEGIRPVISAHTGINRAKMFSDLTELEKGDLFFLLVQGETFAYEVCDIRVILPEEVSVLTAEKGRDLVTLMTCTPYGVNTHRLIVTGERTDYEEGMEDRIEVSTEGSRWMRAYRRALAVGIIAAAGLLLFQRLCGRVEKKRANKT